MIRKTIPLNNAKEKLLQGPEKATMAIPRFGSLK